MSYEWSLENFSSVTIATGSFVTSPLIPTDHPEIKWRLALFPHGRNEANKDYLSVSIQLFSGTNAMCRTEIPAVVRLFLINFEDHSVHEYAQDYKFKLLPEVEYHNTLLPEAMSHNHFAKRQIVMNENNKILVNNDLRIGCEMIFYHLIFCSYQDGPCQSNCRLEEFDDFEKLLADDKFSDFTFDVGNKEIRVHKAILASRSPVFEAMFTNEMQEKKQNRAEISDIQYSVLKELFRFIYTGTVNELNDMASELLIAADKYCVTGLKALCEKALYDNLNVDNALERLILADTHNSTALKVYATEFIVNNPCGIVTTSAFATLPSDLMCNITRGLNRRLALYILNEVSRPHLAIVH